MIFKIRLTIVFLFLLSYLLFAESAGTTSFEFLRNQYSARGAALGGNLIAIKGDLQGVLYNPATLSENTDKQWSLNYVDHLLDFQAGYLAFAIPMGNTCNLHSNLIYFNYGSFNETDEFGEETGRTFNASEFALSAGISNRLGAGFDYGITTKFFFSNIDDFNASGIALDAGLLYTVAALDDLILGLSLSNFGTTLENYTEVKEKLPLTLRVGFAKRLTHLPLLITGSLIDITDYQEKVLDRFKNFAIGGEFDISKILKFRLGYENIINRSVKPLSRDILNGISLGLGINWRTFRFDYGYSNFGDLGSQNRLGITGIF